MCALKCNAKWKVSDLHQQDSDQRTCLPFNPSGSINKAQTQWMPKYYRILKCNCEAGFAGVLQVTSRNVMVEGRIVGMPLLLAGCLWIASKLEEGRKRVPSTTKMAALACTDRTLIAAVEVHLMDLLSWQPLRGWHSP